MVKRLLVSLLIVLCLSAGGGGAALCAGMSCCPATPDIATLQAPPCCEGEIRQSAEKLPALLSTFAFVPHSTLAEDETSVLKCLAFPAAAYFPDLERHTPPPRDRLASLQTLLI